MGSDFKAIPLVDISALVEKVDDPGMAGDGDLLDVVRELDRACKDAGFFYVKGHGIAEPLMAEVRDVTRSFFQLPLEEKRKIRLTPRTGYSATRISNRASMEISASIWKEIICGATD
ncbi:homoarginine-6-hydroxylase 2-ODD-233 isoform X10 [Aegilops tauschii subsp. strangulata]|uniref:homoarginine-6-hydroxylase 2-ODD-233 isoform X10 n=1 Tax=Aegilops tauschii subsp. strangulata TaxID=200361 RepID=UPI003CC86E6B